MLGQQLRTVIVSRDDLVDVHAMLVKLRSGQALTALESGVAIEPSIKGLQIVDPVPQLVFDGFKWTQVLYVTTG